MKHAKIICLIIAVILSLGSICFSAEDISRQREEILSQGIRKWTVPIEFYGQVLDQNSQPVTDANVSIKVTHYDPTHDFFESDKTVNLVTDENGKFELADQGRKIRIKIEKTGYEYPYGTVTPQYFNYSQKSRAIHQPDAANPEIIHLYKKTYPACLTGSGPSGDQTVRNYFDITQSYEKNIYITGGYYDAYGKDGLMPDGVTSLGQFDSRSGTKDIQISGTVPSENMYEFEFSPLVANSGLILSDDRFEEAPESGEEPENEYVSSVTISIPTDNRADFKKYIYAKIANTSFYSRLDLEIKIGTRGKGQLIITSWTNPAGSRNLKYDYEYQLHEKNWRKRLNGLREAAEIKDVVARRRYLKKYDLGDVIGIKPDGTFDEALFQQEADVLKAQLKSEDPRWWHALETTENK